MKLRVLLELQRLKDMYYKSRRFIPVMILGLNKCFQTAFCGAYPRGERREARGISRESVSIVHLFNEGRY